MALAGDVIAFVSTTQPEAARAFYRDKVGLRLVDETPFALVFGNGGTMLRVTRVDQFVPQPFTVLGWRVDDIAASMADLSSRGVVFEQYAGLTGQDAIWTTPGGDRVAWFKDAEGNVLSLTEFAT